MFGYGAMAPFVIGTIMAVGLSTGWGALANRLTVLWAAAILVFLAGVRRGVSFATTGGPTLPQLAMMLWLFLLGLAVLLLPPRLPALVLLLLGYATLAVLDPLAARRGEAPLFFARLRPMQMAIPIVCLLVLVVMQI